GGSGRSVSEWVHGWGHLVIDDEDPLADARGSVAEMSGAGRALRAGGRSYLHGCAERVPVSRLAPGQNGSLKARPDGTVLDGARGRHSSASTRDNREIVMSPDLFRIPGPWRGKLAVITRPRGREWLDDKAAGW